MFVRIARLLPVLMALAALPGLAADATVFGAGISAPEPVSLAELLDQPERFVGKTVRVDGRIGDVCPRRGCWIDVVEGDPQRTVRVKVDDGVIVFPAEAKGSNVSAEGVFTRIEMDHEQSVAYARHLAEEKGEAFDPATVHGPRVVYQIQGAGAVVY